MENNETWRDRFRQIGAGSVRFMATRPEVIAFFESELLTLADKIGAEKKGADYIGSPQHAYSWDAALDTAISVIKEMVK